jgi:hypothetical protein
VSDLPPSLQPCLEWIKRQPELKDGWISYSARAMLLRLWKERDDEIAALNARIMDLEQQQTIFPVRQLKDGDKLIVQLSRPLPQEQRQHLLASLHDVMENPEKRTFVFGNECTLFILRGAPTQSPWVELVSSSPINEQ